MIFVIMKIVMELRIFKSNDFQFVMYTTLKDNHFHRLILKLRLTKPSSKCQYCAILVVKLSKNTGFGEDYFFTLNIIH